MKNAYILSFAILIIFSCKSQEAGYTKEVKQLCRDYIEYIEDSEFRKKSLLVEVTEEVHSNQRYRAFRVSACPPYLPEGLVPDDLDNIKNYLVIYFLESEAHPSRKDRIRKKLDEMKLYSEKALQITSNYPEWVLIIDNQDKSRELIKDAWYKPLDELITSNLSD